MNRRRAFAAAFGLVACVAFGFALRPPSAADGPAPPPPRRLVTVFAAASLQDAFQALAPGFRAAHPEFDVRFAFAGTPALAVQLEQGAPADVFAAADQVRTPALVAAGLIGAPVVFAENDLVVVVSAEKRSTLTRFEDLSAATRVVVGADEVPVGRYTRAALDRLDPTFRGQLEARIVSRELNVRQVLAKVRLGEAEAGFVYRSDATSAGGAVGLLELPPDARQVARYPVATVIRAPQPEGAAAFVAFLRGPAGRAALTAAGLRVPGP